MEKASINVVTEGFSNFREWFFHSMHNLNDVMFAKLYVLIWGIWKQRNMCLLEGVLQQPAQVMFGLLSFFTSRQ